MASTAPLGHGLGVRFDKAPDPRTYAFPLTWTAPSPPPDTDLRPIMSPVQDQGAANSCTGFAGTACLEALLRTANDPLPDRPPPLQPGAQSVGGHALPACIWFNDNSAGGGYGYVGVKNSWGEARGDAGYFYLPAGYFLNGIVREVWVLGWATLPLPMPVPPT